MNLLLSLSLLLLISYPGDLHIDIGMNPDRLNPVHGEVHPGERYDLDLSETPDPKSMDTDKATYHGTERTTRYEDHDSIYRVPKLARTFRIDSNWEKEPWQGISPIRLDNYMGDLPEHRPGVQVKVAHDEESVYVIFKVDDQYVHCIVDEYQGPVFRDSCVEFFFTPSTDLSNGYFNLEVNCGGTALFHFQKQGEERIRIPETEFNKIELVSSMPRIVDPEIQEPVTWTLEYRIPVSLLEQYTTVNRPGPDVEWRANFFKIADRTSHPHWLTWSFVDHPTPRFHMPEYFGTLRFE